MRPLPPVLTTKAANKPKPIPASQPFQAPLWELPYVPPKDAPTTPAPEAPVQAPVVEVAPTRVELPPPAPAPLVLAPEKKLRERKVREKEELQDPSKRDVGEVLRNQKTLTRREVYRRRLFPVSFEYAAGQVSEADIILGERPNLVEAIAYFLFLVAFIVFVAANADISLVHSANSSLYRTLAATHVPSGSGYNGFSALAAQSDPALTEVTVKGSDALYVSLPTLKTKADTASWLRDGLFGLPSFPHIGKSVVCGPCVRLTVRRVSFVTESSEIGYTEVWPVDAASPSQRLGSGKLELTSPLSEVLGGVTDGTQGRLQWTYTAYPVGSDKTFNAGGGYAQMVCGADAKEMLENLSQHQPLSRFPPWFLPNALIGNRRTVNVVADFLSVNPESYATSYTAITFQFTSAGSLTWRVRSRTALSSEGKNLAGVRYGSFGIAVAFLLAYLWYQYVQVRVAGGFRPFVKDWWNAFAVVHLLLVLLTFAFFLLASFVTSVPAASGVFTEEGFQTVQSEWLKGDLTESFNEKAATVERVATFSQLFWTMAAIGTLCGCVLMIRYLRVWGGAAAKTMDWTLKRLFLPTLMCIAFMLVVLSLFVAIGNISFGIDNRAFAGYYESLTASASFLLGGTVGNYNVYDIVEDHRIFAGLYFGPLFILFSFVCFNILVALVLKTYDYCAEEVEKSMKKQKKKEDDYRQTRLGRCMHGLSTFWNEVSAGITSTHANEKIVDLASESSQGEKEEADDDEPPQYPGWMWQSMGLPSPYTEEGWIDPHIWSEYGPLYGAWGECYDIYGGTAAEGGWMNADDFYYMQYADMQSQPAIPEIDKIQRVVQYKQADDRETSWHKILWTSFLCVLVVVVSWQVLISSALPLQNSVNAALRRTTWTPPPTSYTFDDQSLGLKPLALTVLHPSRPFTSIQTADDIHSWLGSETGFFYFLRKTTPSDFWEKIFAAGATTPDNATSRPFLINSWGSMPLPLSVRLRLRLSSTTSTYPLSFNFLATDASTYDLFLSSGSSDDELLALLKRFETKKLVRAACSSLEISFLLYNNFKKRNQVSLASIKFDVTSGGSVKTVVHVPSMGLKPYDKQQGGAAIILQSFVLLMLLFFVASGLYLLYRSFHDAPLDHINCGSVCFRLFSYFCDNFFNLLDLVLLTLFIAAVVLWCFFAFSTVHRIYFTTSGSGFAFSAGTTEAPQAAPEEAPQTAPEEAPQAAPEEAPQAAMFAKRAAAAAASGEASPEAFAGSSSSPDAGAGAAPGADSALYQEMNGLFSSLREAQHLLEVYVQLCGAVVGLAFMRTLRLFEKRKRMVVLFFTVVEAFQHLLFLIFTLFFAYLGLVFTCYLSFGSDVDAFAGVQASFVSSFLLLLGSFPLSDLFRANGSVAAIVVYPFLFLVNLIFLSLFLSVLLRSFAARLGEVESAEALLARPPRTLMQSVRLFFKELVCQFEAPAAAPAARTPPAAEAGEEEESLDEFAVVQEIDEAARKRRNKPLKVIEVPKEIVTTQLTDEQWIKLPPKVREWAAVEAGEFADLFRQLFVQSELAGEKKVGFIQQTEKKFFEKISVLAKEVEQQEAHLGHRLAVYKNNIRIEQDKLANYTTYLEQALDERQRELEMLRRELELIKTRAEERKQEADRRRASRH
ncbi:hypothetical protein BESB_005800 [Besnoitia besnoiti]|uniref:Polycystin cation channel PKD1/PKD2 domain-containing protein n=1 Tax=Besnoitia besnoiti TaxID=94643 RepID=A0A2A9MJZ4_BESBE|nr:hypothetical protein BESB_005800 [Besnoitia besnoiti]PFH38239.1 hypothetical protein BESB_005800 [Besnoitia besnoiti]